MNTSLPSYTAAIEQAVRQIARDEIIKANKSGRTCLSVLDSAALAQSLEQHIRETVRDELVAQSRKDGAPQSAYTWHPKAGEYIVLLIDPKAGDYIIVPPTEQPVQHVHRIKIMVDDNFVLDDTGPGLWSALTPIRLATRGEIEAHLIAEANRKGFVHGAYIKDTKDGFYEGLMPRSGTLSFRSGVVSPYSTRERRDRQWSTGELHPCLTHG